MAKIIDNDSGRRMVALSTDDVISVVKEYQNITHLKLNYKDIRRALDSRKLYIPEEI